jgi:hypothetical protein
MLNYLHEMSREDISRSFNETYIAVNVAGEGRRAAYVVGVGRSSISCVIGGKTREIPHIDIDLEQPDMGMMWLKGDLYYVARNPDKQWRRGLRARGMSMYALGVDGSSVWQSIQNSQMKHIARYFIEGSTTHENILSRDFARRGKYLFLRSIPVGTIKGGVLSCGYDLNLQDYVGEHISCQ